MKRDLTTLGLNDGHNAGAALVRNGVVTAAVQEERLVNVKDYSGVPHRAVRWVLQSTGVHPSEVDVVALVSLNRVYAPRRETPKKVQFFEAISPLVHSHAWSNLYVRILARGRLTPELLRCLQENGLGDSELAVIEHHTAHAATAFYPRPWTADTLVLTADGAGDGLCATVNVGRGDRIERIAKSTYYDSPGNSFYSEVTAYLGMTRWSHEYKVMGLAPYGRPDACLGAMGDLIRLNPDRPMEFQNLTRRCGTRVQATLRKRLRGQRFDNIAAAAQRHFEELMTQWVRNAIEATNLRRVACSGGLFLNVKANKLLRSMQEVEEIFFYPACDDGGTPVGAALEAYHRLCDREGLRAERHALEDIYYGPRYDDETIATALKSRGLAEGASFVDDPADEVAGLLARGKIVARFDGGVEWGPRALGNRSIMADPRNLGVVRRLNQAIKQRDFWMPFAPSILDARSGDYLVDSRPAPYMIEAFDTTPKGEEIIAALHPQDRTARPQVVNGWNPGYRRVLEGFQEATGVGAILNTSLNLHGYPIAGCPEAALWTFENSQLDALLMGHYLLRR